MRRAVRTGEIIKPLRCEKCGVEEELHGHHADYTKPLEVTWLCARCHRQAHPERSDALDTLFSRAEVAEADNRDLDAAIDGLIADRDYFEGVAREAEAECDKLAARMKELETVGQEMLDMIESVDYEPAGYDAGPSNDDLNRWHAALRPTEEAEE